MAGPVLKSCCKCFPLRTGSIITGALCILLSIVTIILVLTLRVAFKTFFFDWLPASVVKIVIVFNLCMTIVISLVMIVGAIKVNNYRKKIMMNKNQRNKKTFSFYKLQRNYYLMLPWVVLGFMLIISLLISVIYNGVVFIIDGELLTAIVWLLLGLLLTGKFFENYHKF